MDEICKGVYEHYKGRRYEVMGQVFHSETCEPMVLYKMLYASDFPEGTLWVRPLAMFKESVVVDGKTLPRFRYLKDT